MVAPRRRYPIGIQTFSEIREGGYVYVDKTADIYNLVTYGSKYTFLSRPRRFGKSLLCSTLKAYFEGHRKFFEGLAIEHLENDWEKHPVIYLSLGWIKTTDVDVLRESISSDLREYEVRYGHQPEEDALGARLKNIIKQSTAATGKKAVVIIDEYDNPLLNVIHMEDEKVRAVRAVMTELFGPLKDCDAWLRFVFITGVTKFSQMSIFSSLNNIKDISMKPEYATLCGITLEELMSQMEPDISALATTLGLSLEKTVERLKHYYDGYAFSRSLTGVFNPFSLLNCLDDSYFKPFWFSTGTPTYLVEMLRKYDVAPSTLTGLRVSTQDFDVPTEALTGATPLLYQSGYLTIKGYDPVMDEYILSIPNQEVRLGLMNSLLPNYVQKPQMTNSEISSLVRHLMKGQLTEGLEGLQTFFSEVPYCDNTSYEGHWQQMLYVVFSLIGAYADVEVHTRKGRVDMAMVLADTLYLVEVKLNSSAREALDQIDRKEYAERFRRSALPLIKIGMNFSTTERTLTEWLIEPSR
ncbi:MAG: ATP-binding protein [Bacteroidales bacterium]|nr:ATP-binding protein [Bacteroidales bacterium]